MTAQLNARGDVAVLCPAAGAGLRLGSGGPKALRLLAGEPLLVHAIRRVAAAPSVRVIVVAAPAAEVEAVRELLAPVAPVTVVAGGAERQESVALALAAVPAGVGIVLVHDAARALTPPELIESVAAAVRAGHPAVIPVLPVVDTIKEVGPGPELVPALNAPSALAPRRDAAGPGRDDAGLGAASVPLDVVLGTVDRAVLRSVQTPQGFRYDVLVAAHAAAGDSLTDDAGLVEKAGLPVACVPGSELAMKITRPLDLILAEALLHVS
ncbi:2-C-methyl-D-erythritol 4-phosphate cytidylyltransferase [Actinoplanes sp. NPDC026619]|uniref:IspD/TarI family cytidylyltransferase n=1 Tax=Actinoplanes sp. NPDC026619 TaxID=3155798 RepID=UPI0033D31C96